MPTAGPPALVPALSLLGGLFQEASSCSRAEAVVDAFVLFPPLSVLQTLNLREWMSVYICGEREGGKEAGREGREGVSQ